MTINKKKTANNEPLKKPENAAFAKATKRFPVPAGVDTPWFNSVGDVPVQLDYFDGMMVEAIEATAKAHPNVTAYDFYGNRVTFKGFIDQIHKAARGLKAYGIDKGDRVTICMPNTPQAIILFYAINRIGAIANMIHPLSGEEEIVGYINNSESKLCMTLLQFYPKFEKIMPRLKLDTLLICDVTDGLAGIKKVLFPFTRKGVAKLPKKSSAVTWQDFMAAAGRYDGEYVAVTGSDDTAAILYSGGTTGTNKGIMLSNMNFNALALQTGSAGDCLRPGHKMLAVMPIFHGFGLGICIHTALYWGGTAVLVPQFDLNSYCKLLKKEKPNYIAGVPTLFEALLRLDDAQDLDLSQLEGIFSGGDSLSIELKGKVDAFLREHGAGEQIREGFGTTECVTASCLTPRFSYREGSIGVPFPDTYYKIVVPYTQETADYGTVGEICIAGPTVMQGYMNNLKETAQTLQVHEDGLTWLHTGDLGTMDEEGFIYFKQRLKRMIITSGYNVYPSQVENVIDSHPDVLISTVIGVKDDYRMHRVKAFIVLRDGGDGSQELVEELKAHCAKNLPKYAIPREFEFRKDLPKTLVGKVAYRELEKEEEAKQ